MEKYKKGGYSILDLESSTIYADSVKALDSNKPVVVYDGTNKPYFADTISLDGTSVVITKGGKTITIANDNTITNVGDIQVKLYTYEFEISGEADDEANHEIRFMFNSTKQLTNNNVIDYFAHFSQSYDWSFVGEDFENTILVAINTIDSAHLYARDFTNEKDLVFDLTNEDVTISVYLINEE